MIDIVHRLLQRSREGEDEQKLSPGLLTLGREVINILRNPLELFENLYSQSRTIMIGDKSYVVKSYGSEIGLLKWYIVTLSNLAVRIYPFTQDPYERLEREVSFHRSDQGCFAKPKYVIVDYVGLRSIREFIKGNTYDFKAPIHIHREVGRCIGECHRRGWVLGDTKITNFLYTETKVYNVDAEQALNSYNAKFAAWDILVLISTLSINGYVKAIRDEYEYERIIDELIEGYIKGNPEHHDVLDLFNTIEFRTLTYLLIPFPLNQVFTRRVENHRKK